MRPVTLSVAMILASATACGLAAQAPAKNVKAIGPKPDDPGKAKAIGPKPDDPGKAKAIGPKPDEPSQAKPAKPAAAPAKR